MRTPAASEPAGATMPPGWSVALRTKSAAETRALAAAIAEHACPGDLYLLVGGLGAGKTVFAQGFAKGLGVEQPITSPAFVLAREYRCTRSAYGVATLVHADVYRLDRTLEIAELGLAELLDDGAVALVEWGDVAMPVLGGEALSVQISAPGTGEEPETSDEEQRRDIVVAGLGRSWEDRADELQRALDPFRRSA